MEMNSRTKGQRGLAVAVGAETTERCLFPVLLPVCAFAALVIAGAVSTGAQTGTTVGTQKQKPASTAPATSKPAVGMPTGQSSGTIPQTPKTSSSMLLAPSLPGADVERMSHDQFRALPDTAAVRYRGQSMTKGAFIQQRFKEWRALGSGPERKPTLGFEALKNQFQQKQASDLQAQNARVQAVIDRLNLKLKEVESSSEYLALLKEAGSLRQRYATSSPEEQSRLKARALQIHEELSKMERVE